MPNKPKAHASPRAYAVVQNLKNGMGRKEACVKAGYSKSYANSFSARIIGSQDVAMALAELGAGQGNRQLGDMAKARLYEDLVKPPKGDKGAKARLGIIRTGLEIAGDLGGPSELHLHSHRMLSPVAEKMMLEMMMKKAKEQGLILEAQNGGAAISERAEGRGEGGEDDGGVQGGEPALGVEEGASGQ